MMKHYRYILLLSLIFANIILCAQPVQYAKRTFNVPGVRYMQRFKVNTPDATILVSGLPKGLSWNGERQLVEGTLSEEGTYHYFLHTWIDGVEQRDTIELIASYHLPQPTPFMGYLTWNLFERNISSNHLRTLANAMHDLHLHEAGYNYLCIDDCWAQPKRGRHKTLLYDTQKFPEGMNNLTDYIHSLGLKCGIYSDAGTHTCTKLQPGSLYHEESDAQQFIQWGFDLLKYDFCNNNYDNDKLAQTMPIQQWASHTYTQMHKALQKVAPSDFIFYICEWGHTQPWLWASEAGGTCWRATDDTRDCWTNEAYKGGVLDNIKIFVDIWPYTGVNHFNDADMLMCGLHGMGRSSNDGTNGKGLSIDEYQTQFILWCMWSSPLTLCFDITTLFNGHSQLDSTYNKYYQIDLDLITKSEIIAIDQDPMGMCAEPLRFTDDELILIKDLADGDFALSITNLSNKNRHIEIDFREIKPLDKNNKYKLRDIWTATDMNMTFEKNDALELNLEAHATAIYRIHPLH